MRLHYIIGVFIILAGCGVNKNPNSVSQSNHIVLYASEYPSWSTFGVASRQGLINGEKGKLGPIEKKWGVDLEVKMVTYETCITNWGTSGGAICITNTDIVGLVASRPATAILPTSTSYGADACIGINGVYTVDDLKSEVTYGLEKSVSDFAWYRALEKLGKNPSEYKFKNRDPEQAAQALQTGASSVGQVWNPFTLQTLRTKKDAKIIFDSTIIPDEIVDMVVIDNETLRKPGGDAAAQCIIDTYYAVCENLKAKDKKLSDDTYLALGDQFSSLKADEMRQCADMASNPDQSKKITTRFYDTPELGIRTFMSGHMQPIMTHVLRWAKSRQVLDEDPTISYAESPGNSMLTFDSSYMTETWKSR